MSGKGFMGGVEKGNIIRGSKFVHSVHREYGTVLHGTS
jgi:hypothetical protein